MVADIARFSGFNQSNCFLVEKQLPVLNVGLSSLLIDKTTGRNITWSSDSYIGIGYQPSDEITVNSLSGFGAIVLQSRVAKSLAMQKSRTKTKAEVFTPAWVCNKMNNDLDAVWFGRPDVFNVVSEDSRTWITTTEKIVFGKGRRNSWQGYVDSRRMEITCGEAPFITSRYDAFTGEWIELKNRIGMLDRKLRVVAENVETAADYIKWSIRALQSIYGYEYQGDNLLIGRINMLMSWSENVDAFCGRLPNKSEIKKAANVIAWNLWQMDGIKGCVPETGERCWLRDWRAGGSGNGVKISYDSMRKDVG